MSEMSGGFVGEWVGFGGRGRKVWGKVGCLRSCLEMI